MRVLHVAADLGTYGAERFVILLLERLRNQPIELAALSIAPARGIDSTAGVEYFSAGRRGRYDLAFVARMIATMRAWRPDIVHTHTHAGKYWGRLAAVVAGVPAIVHTEHNSEFGAPAPFRILNAALSRRTTAFVAVSRAQRDRLVNEEGIPSDRIAVIPNGVPIGAFDPAARPAARAALGANGEEALIVHVGRLSPVKNQRLAIEALSLLDAPARLVLIGAGPERDRLESLARERGVAERTSFLGYRSDAAALIAGADVALVTSRNEAMPLAIIEALLARAPVVSTPWLGASEMLGDGAFGLVTADFEPRSVAAAIRSVLDEPGMARERAERGAAFARTEHDIAATARRYEALYRAINARSRVASAVMTAPRS